MCTELIRKYAAKLKEEEDCISKFWKNDDDRELPPGDFSLAEMWETINRFGYSLRKSSLNFHLACNACELKDAEVDSLIKPIVRDCSSLCAFVVALPVCCGKQLRKELSSFISDIVSTISEMITSYMSESNRSAMCSRIMAFSKDLRDLPRTNTHAVTAVIKGHAAVVDDAFSEIQTALENSDSPPTIGVSEDNVTVSDEESATWTEEDKLKLRPAVDVVKSVAALLGHIDQWLTNQCSVATADTINKENVEKWRTLDRLLEVVDELPEIIDDLVLAMYPPLAIDAVKNEAEKVVTRVGQAVTVLLQSAIGDESTPDFLSQLHLDLQSNSKLIFTNSYS